MSKPIRARQAPGSPDVLIRRGAASRPTWEPTVRGAMFVDDGTVVLARWLEDHAGGVTERIVVLPDSQLEAALVMLTDVLAARARVRRQDEAMRELRGMFGLPQEESA